MENKFPTGQILFMNSGSKKSETMSAVFRIQLRMSNYTTQENFDFKRSTKQFNISINQTKRAITLEF